MLAVFHTVQFQPLQFITDELILILQIVSNVKDSLKQLGKLGICVKSKICFNNPVSMRRISELKCAITIT